MAEDGTVFNYGHQIPHEGMSSKYIATVEGPGVHTAPTFVLRGKLSRKVEQELPPNELIMYNLET